MAISYQPKKLLKRIAKKEALESLVSKKLTVNKVALRAVVRTGVLSADQVTDVALRVIKDYKERYQDEIDEGASRSDAFADAVGDRRLLVQRIQNATVNEVTKRVKKAYRGEKYTWLPSTAANPDPAHVKKYGKVFRIGRGEAPGDRYGCQCGMKIHVVETDLNIEDF